MNTVKVPWFLIFESILLFLILPLLYLADVLLVHKVIPLVILLAYCAIILLLDKPANPNRFRLAANWKLIAIRLAIIAAVVFLLIKFYFHLDLFADLPQNRKLFYMILMYPVLSALPQEVIFREFFFYRYETLFRHPAILVAVNVVLFAFAHIYRKLDRHDLYAGWWCHLCHHLQPNTVAARGYYRTYVIRADDTVLGTRRIFL